MIYVWIPLLFILTDAQFISSPDSTFSQCPNSELDLPWTYSVTTNVAASVNWKKDGLTMLTWTVPINNYGYENGYNSSKIVHKTNGHVVINTLSASDAGVYTCEVTYDVTGTKIQSPGVTLQISSCSTDTECGWCSIECGYRRWCIALIVIMVIALLGIVPIFLTISMKRECCCFSNDGSRTGNRCLGSHIACLHFDSRVSIIEPNVNNQTPNSGRNLNDVRPLPNIGEQH